MRTSRHFLMRVVLYFALIVLALLFLIPILIAANTAFKPQSEIWEVTSLPSKLFLGSLIDGFNRVKRGILNSILITFPSMVLSVFVGSLAAYPLSQLKFRGDTAIYFFLLAGMYIPYTTVLIPLFLLIKKLGLYDTIPGLWLAHTAYGIPYTTLILRNFFATIPGNLREAASLDGCGLIAYYWRILLPVGRTGIATILILQFRGIWNEFLFGLTLTRRPERFPVTVHLQTFVSLTDLQWGPLMGATIFAIIPTLVVFLLFKKHFVSGLTGVYK